MSISGVDALNFESARIGPGIDSTYPNAFGLIAILDDRAIFALLTYIVSLEEDIDRTVEAVCGREDVRANPNTGRRTLRMANGSNFSSS
jgi:hypothetical protein